MANGPLIIDLMHPMDVVLQFPTVGRVRDKNVDIPLWVKYDGKPYDLTGHRLGFYGRDAKGVAKIALQDPVGPAIEAGRVTFKMPGAAFRAAGQYEEAWFRVEKDEQLVSSLNVKFNVLENNVEFGVDDEPYYSEIEILIQNFLKDINASKSNAEAVVNDYRKKFQDLFNQISDQASDMARHLKIMIAQLDVIQDKINSRDIATNSQLKEELLKLKTNLLDEINNRPTNQNIIDMIKRGFTEFDGGRPHAIADAATLKKTYPKGHDGVFVTIDTGHMWMWGPEAEWIDGGLYQGKQIDDKSIDNTKLAENAQAPIFVPSRDGLPDFDTKNLILDFNCITYSAYFNLNNEMIEVPKGLKLTVPLHDATSAKLIYNRTTKRFMFTGWNYKLGKDQVFLGAIRHGYENATNAYYWSGSFDITIDGRQWNQRDIPAVTLFSVGSSKMPNFNTQTLEFDFGSTTTTTPSIQIGTKLVQVKNGVVAKPTAEAKRANTLRVTYNIFDNTAKVVAWNEKLPRKSVVICMIVRNFYRYPYITGGFPYTIDGEVPDARNHNVELVPSRDGSPILNHDDFSLDFNCYTDSAYIIYDGKSYQIPRNTVVSKDGEQNYTSIRYLCKPSTMEFRAINWNTRIDNGWVQIAAARVTKNNEVLTTAAFPITVKGASFKPTATDNPLNAKIKGINHRGFNTVAPEESRSAYLLSKQNGYHHWEGDINWTKDNVPMMIHDKAINRTARNLDGSQVSGTVNITDLNYADLAKYDFGIVKGERFKGEPLLSFEELVRLARYSDTFLHIEFKYAFTQEQVQILHNIAKKYNMLDRIGWQAFGWDNLKPMMALEPNGQYELLGGDINDDYFNKMDALKTDNNTIIASQDASRSVADIQKIADKGYPIYLWTVDDGDTVRKFRDIGLVEGIMTNGAINVADEISKW